jgi:hypothetical protein
MPRESGQLRQTLKSLHLLRVLQLVHWSISRLLARAEDLLHKLTRVPRIGTILASLIIRFDRRPLLTFDVEEVMRVCSALDSEGISYWIAGGWGTDALVGSQTKRHADLDVVLGSFESKLELFDHCVARLGYGRRAPLGGTIWFPDDAVYEDARGHRIEVLCLEWRLLSKVQRSGLDSGASEDPSPANAEESTSAIVERCTTNGLLRGNTIPVLTVNAQRLLHTGYERRREDEHAETIFDLVDRHAPSNSSLTPHVDTNTDVASQTSLTLLFIPFFAWSPELWKLCKLLHNDLDAMPPHVTLAYPFLPLHDVNEDVIRQLTELFAAESAFDIRLESIRWFDEGVVYLEPSAAERLRTIIAALQELFPDFHPYGGAFDAVVPHVTLSQHGSIADRRLLARRAAGFLPLNVFASHVWMMTNAYHPNSWSIREIFPLGDSELSS